MARKRTAEVDLNKLCEAIRASRLVLEPFRVSRMEAVRKYAGDQWSTETAMTKRPINFLSLYLQILSRNLIAHDPRAMLSVKKAEYRATVSAMEEWLNPQIKRMGLADSLHRGGIDAIYGFHVMKVGLATPAEAEKTGWEVEFGQPYASCIDLDDWAMDPHARTLRELAWMGHRTRVRTDSIKDSNLYEAASRKKVQSNVDRQYNEPGDERISMLGRQYVSGEVDSEAYDYCDLWEIYLPMEKMIITMLSEDGGTPSLDLDGENPKAFAQRNWVGPYCGPYHFLNLMPPVSGNAMPKGPIQDLIDMDFHLNGIMQKLIEQAARQKEILACGNAADGDAERVVNARDGEAIRMDNPDKMKPVGFGGPHPNNQAFAMGMWDLLSKLGGNIELMGGLGEQSKTATQDKMLNANAGVSVKWMQAEMVKHTAKVIESLCWFYHHHPTKVMTSYHEIEGLDEPIERKVRPEDREKVPFEAMDIKVDPFSLQFQAPGEKMGFIKGVMSEMVIPLLPLLKEQGIGVNMGRFLELMADFSNVPELMEVITNLAESQGIPQGEEEQPAKPGNTTRTYNRVNASEKTEGGQSKVMQQALLGQNAGGRPSNNGSYKPVGG